MATLALTASINAAPNRVFAAFTDLERGAEHVSGITRLEVLTDGPIGRGTRFRETRVMFGKEATETMEITVFDPPHVYALEADSCGARWRTEFHFIGEGPNTTRLQIETTITPVSFLAKLLSPLSKLMMGTMRKCIERDIADLKEVCESADRSAKPGIQGVPSAQGS